jgi:hypothetical protein
MVAKREQQLFHGKHLFTSQERLSNNPVNEALLIWTTLHGHYNILVCTYIFIYWASLSRVDLEHFLPLVWLLEFSSIYLFNLHFVHIMS